MQVIMNLVGWALDALIVAGVLAALVAAIVLAVRKAPLRPRTWIALGVIAVVLMVLTEPAKLILVALGQGGYLGLSGRTVATALLGMVSMACAGVFLALSAGKKRLLKLLLLLPTALYALFTLISSLIMGYVESVYLLLDVGMLLAIVLLVVWYATNRSVGAGIPLALLSLLLLTAGSIWGRYFGLHVLDTGSTSELSRLLITFSLGLSPSQFLLLLLAAQAGLLSAKLRATAPAQPAQPTPPAQPAPSAARFCTHCGAPVPAQSRFCTRCGRPL